MCLQNVRGLNARDRRWEKMTKVKKLLSDHNLLILSETKGWPMAYEQEVKKAGFTSTCAVDP